MWTWGKTGEFSYPSLNHYYTNNKTNQIDFKIKKDLYDNIKLIGKDDDNLKKDLIEKKMSIDLFKIKNNSFNTINKDVPSLFKNSHKTSAKLSSWRLLCFYEFNGRR